MAVSVDAVMINLPRKKKVVKIEYSSIFSLLKCRIVLNMWTGILCNNKSRIDFWGLIGIAIFRESPTQLESWWSRTNGKKLDIKGMQPAQDHGSCGGHTSSNEPLLKMNMWQYCASLPVSATPMLITFPLCLLGKSSGAALKVKELSSFLLILNIRTVSPLANHVMKALREGRVDQSRTGCAEQYSSCTNLTPYSIPRRRTGSLGWSRPAWRGPAPRWHAGIGALGPGSPWCSRSGLCGRQSRTPGTSHYCWNPSKSHCHCDSGQEKKNVSRSLTRRPIRFYKALNRLKTFFLFLQIILSNQIMTIMYIGWHFCRLLCRSPLSNELLYILDGKHYIKYNFSFKWKT